MVEVAVQRGDDRAAVVVLEVGEQILQVVAVVVVHQRDAAGDLTVAKLLAVFDQMGADHVGDGE